MVNRVTTKTIITRTRITILMAEVEQLLKREFALPDRGVEFDFDGEECVIEYETTETVDT